MLSEVAGGVEFMKMICFTKSVSTAHNTSLSHTHTDSEQKKCDNKRERTVKKAENSAVSGGFGG